MKHFLVGFAFASCAVSFAVAQAPGAVDLKDREFTAEEIVRALIGRRESAPDAAGTLSATRKRGLGVVPSGQQASDASGPRKVSMQLQFEFDSASLSDGALSRLDAVGQALQSPELSAGRFIVSGHTDASGRYEYNLALSKRRAESVRDYLATRHGVNVQRIVTVGKASDDLIDSASPKSAANRRVQLETLD